MISGVRTRKAASTPELTASSLNNVERLIFAQAVHELGSGAWQEVAKLLSKHPMISQPKGIFTPQSCSALYELLMDEAGLEWSETDTAPRAERHLRLAQRYYVARVTELRGLIAAEEVKFKQLVTEIDEIRNGAWNDKILASLGRKAEKPSKEEQHKEDVPEPHGPTPSQPEEALDVNIVVREEVMQDLTMDEVPPLELERASSRETVPRTPQMPEAEEKEEGSDNEAVNELIGDFGSDKPTAETVDEVQVVSEGPRAIVQEEEMQVDEASMKEDEESSVEDIPAEPPAEGVLEEAQEFETPVVEAVEDTPTEKTVEEMAVSLEDDTQDPETPATEPIRERSGRAEGKRKVSDADSASLEEHREKKRLREESEPVDEEEGVPKTRRKGEGHAVSKRFQNMIGMLHSQISQHRYGNIFHNPIKKSEAPDYHDIVKRAMDLKTIKSRVKDGLISNSLEFQRDIYLMFANAMMYNRPGSEIYNMAEEMMIASEREITAFRQTEGFHRM